MLTSLAGREACCAKKGQNCPFDIGCQTSYLVGSTETQKHFGQSSLTLLHRSFAILSDLMVIKY